MNGKLRGRIAKLEGGPGGWCHCQLPVVLYEGDPPPTDTRCPQCRREVPVLAVVYEGAPPNSPSRKA